MNLMTLKSMIPTQLHNKNIISKAAFVYFNHEKKREKRKQAQHNLLIPKKKKCLKI